MHGNHICTVADQRDSLVHVHVLGVTSVVHIDRLARIGIINRCLYRRIVRIERAPAPPPPSFIHANK